MPFLAERQPFGEQDAGSGSLSVSRLLCEQGKEIESLDAVIVEVPIALSFNGISYAVMMATPSDLYDFIRGFAIGEGIVTSPRAIYDIDVTPADSGIGMPGFDVNATVSSEAAHKLKDRKRSMAGPSGCGLCGIESIQTVSRDISRLESVALPSQDALDVAIGQMRTEQLLSQATAGAHAAAWCGYDGDIVALREDVGRHNALDKLIGWHSLHPTDGFVLVSSRASFEMVAKAASAGIGVLAAVSAPTSAAITLAEQVNLTLIAFASRGRHARYC